MRLPSHREITANFTDELNAPRSFLYKLRPINYLQPFRIDRSFAILFDFPNDILTINVADLERDLFDLMVGTGPCFLKQQSFVGPRQAHKLTVFLDFVLRFQQLGVLQSFGLTVTICLFHTIWRVEVFGLFLLHAFLCTFDHGDLRQLRATLISFAFGALQDILPSLFSHLPFLFFLFPFEHRNGILGIHVLGVVIVLRLDSFFGDNLAVGVDAAVPLKHFDLIEQRVVAEGLLFLCGMGFDAFGGLFHLRD